MERPRIALIHATRVAIEPIEAAFAALWPEAETVSILEEGLSADLASGRAERAELDVRINLLADYANSLAPNAILFTCSAFGTGIEQAACRLDVPVLKPNEAMFEAAMKSGERIVMLYSFQPAAIGMEREFAEAADRQGTRFAFKSIYVPEALAALKSGDGDRHDRLIARAAAGISQADAVMLAHFSMSRAASAVRAALPCPVFSSPEAAVAEVRRRVVAMRSAAKDESVSGLEEIC